MFERRCDQLVSENVRQTTKGQGTICQPRLRLNYKGDYVRQYTPINVIDGTAKIISRTSSYYIK